MHVIGAALPALMARGPRAAETSATGAVPLAISSALGPTHPEGAGAAAWAREIAAATPAFDVRHHPGATLVNRDPTRELAALRDGTIALAVGSALQWSSDVRELAVFAL